jgi:hypothetical protein
MVARLPESAVKMWPGYVWQIDLDVGFDGVRPDWAGGAYLVKCDVYYGATVVNLTIGSGITITERSVPGTITNPSSTPINYSIPIIRLTDLQTALFGADNEPSYLIAVSPAGGDYYPILQGPFQIEQTP